MSGVGCGFCLWLFLEVFCLPFWSVDKYGGRQPSLIYCWNLVEILHINSSQLDVSAWIWFWSVNKYVQTAAVFIITNCPLLNTSYNNLVFASPPRSPVGVIYICLRCVPCGQVVSAQNGSGPSTNMADSSHLWLYILLFCGVTRSFYISYGPPHTNVQIHMII